MSNNEQIEYKFKLIESSESYAKFVLIGEPEILHIVKSGHEDIYFTFWEDAYGQEPWRNGIKSVNKNTLEQTFHIDVTDLFVVQKSYDSVKEHLTEIFTEEENKVEQYPESTC